MKPTFNTVEGKDSASMEQAITVSKGGNKSTSRLIVKSVFAITALALVAGAVVGALYLGMYLSREHIKETWVRYTADSGQPVNERIVVTETEEDYETETIRSVYDFQSMLVTHKLAGSNVCYVTKLNASEVDSPSKLYSNLTEIDWDTSTPTRYKYFRSTDIAVPLEALSPRGRDMCKFNKIFWTIQESEDEHTKGGLVKRRAAIAAQSCCCSCGSCCNCGMSFRESMAM